MALLMGQANKPVRVDSHQHFWRYTEEEFGWIDDSMSAIRRDFLPLDLAVPLSMSGVRATVAVQARQTLAETEWLLDLAGPHDWIAGVVGWLPLAEAGAGTGHATRLEANLERLAANPRFKGVRHVLQGEDDAYMADEGFNAGLALLPRYSLTYDLLVLERQLPAAIALVDRHPAQPFVLDHLAKPRIAARELEPWRSHIRELARRPHVACKLSGMVTEADFHSRTAADLRPYVETALEAFGPERLLFGSDWPVLTVASSYGRWVSAVEDFLAELSGDEQASIFGRNAAGFYGLEL